MGMLLLAALLAGSACEKRSYGKVYDRELLSSMPECMKLSLFPPDESMERELKQLYAFEENCPYRLEVSYKNGIHCNSTQNVERKVNSNFPSAYLRMDLYKGVKLLYSYYRDLDAPPDEDDVADAMTSLKEDLSSE